MAEQTIETMRQELEAAGYTGEWMYLGDYQAFVFSFADGIEVSGMDKIESIKMAYRYLQRENRYAELEAFVQEVAHSMLIGNDHLKAQSALYFKDRAKALLGSED